MPWPLYSFLYESLVKGNFKIGKTLGEVIFADKAIPEVGDI